MDFLFDTISFTRNNKLNSQVVVISVTHYLCKLYKGKKSEIKRKYPY